MSRRRIVEIPGVGHVNPIPQAVVIDGMIYTSAISGMDPETGRYVGDPEGQVKMAFANLHRLLALAGATSDDIAKLDVFVNDAPIREMVNREWAAMFPDPHDRPARHAHPIHPGSPREVVVQLEFVAILPRDARA
jgi:2-iminobutanoate/2-iminopropanoate deaminase